MSLLDRVKAIREKHNAMTKDGTSERTGWVTIDRMLAEAIEDYAPRYVKKNPKDLDPEDVPPIERMPPECYEYSRNWGW